MHILFVTTAPPWPPRRGYQMRVDGLASELVERHRVTVLAQRFPGFRASPPPAGIALELFDVTRRGAFSGLLAGRRLPLQVALSSPPGFTRAVARTIDRLAPDVVVLVLSRVGIAAEAVDGLPLVVDLIDSLGLNMRNRAARQPWLRPFLLWEARRILAWDRHLIERAAAVTVVSERDRVALGSGSLVGAETVHVVPVGLRCSVPETSTPRRRAVLLSGNLGYFPTVEGTLWFLHEVWPRIRSVVGDVEMWLAGSRPGRRLRQLDGRNGVRVFCEPADLGEFRRSAAVAVAPLRAGSGTPIKILEAMADGTPVVTTAIGAAGLDGLQGDELSRGETADDFAAAVIRLLADRAFAEQQTLAARRWLIARHDARCSARAFENILRDAVDRTPSKPGREDHA